MIVVYMWALIEKRRPLSFAVVAESFERRHRRKGVLRESAEFLRNGEAVNAKAGAFHSRVVIEDGVAIVLDHIVFKLLLRGMIHRVEELLIPPGEIHAMSYSSCEAVRRCATPVPLETRPVPSPLALPATR